MKVSMTQSIYGSPSITKVVLSFTVSITTNALVAASPRHPEFCQLAAAL
jgi:hypothetical protein